MEIRVLVLLLLSGAVSCRDDHAHRTVGYKKLEEWRKLNDDIRSLGEGKVGEDCNSTPEQTYAYFLLGDLLDFHQVDGIIAYGFPRRAFYEQKFGVLKEVREKRVVVCRHEVRLVCLSSTSKCVSCSDVDKEAEPKLAEACELEGKGGEKEEPIPPEEGEVPKPGTLEKPKEEECDDGWLTAEDVRRWESGAGGAGWMTSGVPCPFNFDLNRGYYLLDYVVKKYPGEGQLEAELRDYWDFYQDRLWMFRGGQNTVGGILCYRGTNGNGDGPWMCGMDAQCIDCKLVKNETYSKNPPEEVKAGCDVQGRPDGWTPRDDKCVKTTTGPPETTTIPVGTTEGSSGVGKEGKSAVVLIATAFLHIGFRV